MDNRLIVVGQTGTGEQYLARFLGRFAFAHDPRINPVSRILRMLRYPDQAALIWPEVLCDFPPLPWGAVVRLPVIREATLTDAAALSWFCDYWASVRFAAFDAIRRARTPEQARMIGLHLAGARLNRVRSVYLLNRLEVEELKIIPEVSFTEVEWRLRHRKDARKEAEQLLAEALSDATSLHGPMARDASPGKGTPGDPTGRGADRILRAREKVAAIEAWEKVFQKTERDFPPGTDQHKIASLHYESGMTMAELSAAMHYDRQTIRRKRDEFIYRAAWYAAEEGLTRRDRE